MAKRRRKKSPSGKKNTADWQRWRTSVSPVQGRNALIRPDAQRLARMTASDTTLNVEGSDLEKMLRDYSDAMVRRGLSMSRRDLRGLDTLDTRGLIPPDPSNGWGMPRSFDMGFEDRLFLIRSYWYGFIPCFEEGVLHVNTGRYVYWKIREIVTDQNRMDIFLADYVYYDNTGWQPGVSGVVTWRFDDPDGAVATAAETGSRLRAQYATVKGRPDYPVPMEHYGDIYRLIDYRRDMGWTRQEIAAWERTMIPYAENVAKQFMQQTGRSLLDELARFFTNCILKANRALDENKVGKSVPVHPREAQESRPAVAEESGKQTPERRVRTIGLLSVTSRTRPRAPTRKGIVRYTTASWTRRGHIRTYKNGRKVYIRETTATRKALQDSSDKNTRPTTIRFDKNKPKKGAEHVDGKS